MEHSVIASICVITVRVVVLKNPRLRLMPNIRTVCSDADELRLAQLLLDHGQMCVLPPASSTTPRLTGFRPPAQVTSIRSWPCTSLRTPPSHRVRILLTRRAARQAEQPRGIAWQGRQGRGAAEQPRRVPALDAAVLRRSLALAQQRPEAGAYPARFHCDSDPWGTHGVVRSGTTVRGRGRPDRDRHRVQLAVRAPPEGAYRSTYWGRWHG